MKIMRLIGGVAVLGLLSVSAYAQDTSQYQFTSANYSVVSDGPILTNEQCQALFGEQEFYDVRNDRSIYKNKKLLMNQQYQRISTTYIDATKQLFLGNDEFDSIINGKKQHLVRSIYFMLDRSESMIKGGWVVPGYCKGNMMGVQQTINKWPRRS